MVTTENRLQGIDDRAALQDVLTAHCNAPLPKELTDIHARDISHNRS